MFALIFIRLSISSTAMYLFTLHNDVNDFKFFFFFMFALSIYLLLFFFFVVFFIFPSMFLAVVGKFSAQFAMQTAAKDVPRYRQVPPVRRLLSVCVADCYSHLDELKAKLTSTVVGLLSL